MDEVSVMMPVTEMLATIDNQVFFEHFTMEEKQRLIGFHTHFVAFHEGAQVIKEGSSDKSFYILLSGSVDVTKGESGHSIATLKPGDFFGEVSFLTDSPRTSNIYATESSLAFKVNHELLNNLTANEREKIKDKIIDRLIKRIVRMNQEVVSLLYS